jgi:hypothetical protein
VKKLTFFVLLLLFTRGLTFYAGGNNQEAPFQFENLLLGSEVAANGNLNQVLAVVVGPRGLVGPAGVAGKNGFVGLNGRAGRDGIPGAPGPIGPGGPIGPAGSVGTIGATGPAGAQGERGPVGPAGAPGAAGATGAQGSAVAVISLAPGDANCRAGGVKLVSANGSASYVCSGSASVSLGGSSADIVSCDSAVDLAMLSHFSAEERRFILDGIRISGLSSTCTGRRLEITLSTTAVDLSKITFVCTVTSLPDAGGADLYLARDGYNLKYGESGRVVPLVCNPGLSTMDLTQLDSILGFQLT